jgi:glyoxylase-like metal-dependent hydrolase (beta-lactamase superfamily II)
MLLPLEDLFNDVIGKAQRGLGISDDHLATQSGVDPEVLARVKDGTVDEEVLEKIAPVLKLHAPSLIVMARKTWRPHLLELNGLRQFNTTYEDMTVNAYLVWDTTTKAGAAFDTGADASDMADMARALGVRLEAIFLTHTHPDHVADIPTLKKGKQPVYACDKEPWEGATLFSVGKEFTVGNLKIETRQTTGHSKGGVTYVIHGLARPIAIVGDAIFASSMGGGAVSYSDALKTNREAIFTLPDNTVVCPGHGPMTTVGEEKQHNPFYPEFKRAPHPVPAAD